MHCEEVKRDGSADAARALLEELLLSGLAVAGLLSTLLDELPAGSFPGEDPAAALLEMAVGSSQPAAAAAGERRCWEASALIGAVRDRLLDDLRRAAELAREPENA